MIQLVVFDMAGTTVDEQNIVYKTIHQVFLNAGYEVSLDTVLLLAAGKEKLQAIKDVLVDIDKSPGLEMKAIALHEEFENALSKVYSSLTPLPLPGAVEVFSVLKNQGIKVVLNTGYKRDIADLLLQKLAWSVGDTIDLLITADDVLRSRPSPDMIYMAMDHFEITNPRVVAKIGDSVADIEEGKNAGCAISAGITTGAQTRAQLLIASPTHVFDHLSELLDFL